MPASRDSGQSPQTLKSCLPLLERRLGEEDGDQPPRVLLELRPLRVGVAVAEDEKVHLRLRRAVLEQWDERARAVRRCVAHRLVLRVHPEGPHRDEGVGAVSLLERHLHRAAGQGEAKRLLEGARALLRVGGLLPLAEDGAEAARVEEGLGRGVADQEPVLARVGVVDRTGGIPRPGQRLDHQTVEAEELLGAAAGVEVVDPEGPWRGGERRSSGEQAQGDEAHGAGTLRQVRRARTPAVAAVWQNGREAASVTLRWRAPGPPGSTLEQLSLHPLGVPGPGEPHARGEAQAPAVVPLDPGHRVPGVPGGVHLGRAVGVGSLQRADRVRLGGHPRAGLDGPSRLGGARLGALPGLRMVPAHRVGGDGGGRDGLGSARVPGAHRGRGPAARNARHGPHRGGVRGLGPGARGGGRAGSAAAAVRSATPRSRPSPTSRSTPGSPWRSRSSPPATSAPRSTATARWSTGRATSSSP